MWDKLFEAGTNIFIGICVGAIAIALIALAIWLLFKPGVGLTVGVVGILVLAHEFGRVVLGEIKWHQALQRRSHPGYTTPTDHDG